MTKDEKTRELILFEHKETGKGELCGSIRRTGIEMLTLLDDLCSRLHIRYTAIGTTLHGAVQCGGFAMGDVIIRIAMLRREYDIFSAAAENIFREPYFWQTAYTDRGSLCKGGRIRRSDTTAIPENERDCREGFNQGVWLEVWPMDTVPESSFFRYYQIRQICGLEGRLSLQAFMNRKHRRDGKMDTGLYAKYERTCAKYSDRKGGTVGPLMQDCWDEHFFLQASDFDDLVRIPFCETRIPVPYRYQEIDEAFFPTEIAYEVELQREGAIWFDVGTSYRDYTKCITEGEKRN